MLGSGAPSPVLAPAVSGNQLIAGDLHDLAAWDGESWSGLGAEPNSFVKVLAGYEDRLVAGGYFRAIGWIPAGGIASWDGTSWSGLYSPTPGVAGAGSAI